LGRIVEEVLRAVAQNAPGIKQKINTKKEEPATHTLVTGSSFTLLLTSIPTVSVSALPQELA
jgi:hypothetical protein